MKTTFLFTIALLLISQVFGQKEEFVPLDSIRFSGRVLDKENGEPLVMTAIIVYEGSMFLTGARSDTSGNFSISFPVEKTCGDQITVVAKYLQNSVVVPINYFFTTKTPEPILIYTGYNRGYIEIGSFFQEEEPSNESNAYRNMFFPKN